MSSCRNNDHGNGQVWPWGIIQSTLPWQSFVHICDRSNSGPNGLPRKCIPRGTKPSIISCSSGPLVTPVNDTHLYVLTSHSLLVKKCVGTSFSLMHRAQASSLSTFSGSPSVCVTLKIIDFRSTRRHRNKAQGRIGVRHPCAFGEVR